MSIETSGVSNPQTVAANTASSRQQSGPSSTGMEPVSTVNNSTSALQQTNTAEQTELSMDKLQDAVEKMNELMQSGRRSLNFSVDDSTEKVVIKVMDLETDEVVRQIPTEETLKFAEYLEGMVGIIFDETV
ncbi:flagellar protein FlaG [Marinobacterium sp. AK62]|uniref:Flagellar protein FlaG n=1 Tax=Marinobacterium alkalitolerans TaxID=1542925 RepID=A0ABS3ZA16_9GAMM|nr:flagellar protein FlaG [Marinobacterium alkalitolerans]MBP0048545.1 flagellar protein FlaG [Marinobacterium alkalitolerans]